ncbi:hypothetical protein CFN78_25675 [Amycolatopsis antarctica]|uniref:Integrase n=1 Tax=Amycolatopsis antarctica TaxID=1854586 RepID=A0A263CWG8_9PSEU|nr:hypothetical protein [Amycolatopsis antarctica]OZM70319.1 hypothetical protein CFN78_25675 [Amycolatopsis antarctica]
MPTIEVAERAGVGEDGESRPSEDRVAVLDNAVVLLDGATSENPRLPAPGWYAGVLADRITRELRETPDADLDNTLARSIGGVANEHGLRKRHAPSSTVAMLRWNASTLDALVLADSPIVVFTRPAPEAEETVTVLGDYRLARLREAGRLGDGSEVANLRNTEEGFWVAEADPAAAEHAITASWPRAEISSVLLASDGVSVGVDEYGLFDWFRLRERARSDGPQAVLDIVRAAEGEDPDRVRWPRRKRHDDQALVLVDFTR